MTDRELISCAVKAVKNAYAPYSGLKVGAAIECFDGSVYTGATVENANFGCTVCAEAAALAAAVSDGKRKFSRIAVYADRTEYYLPCGTCRQMLAEFAPGMEVLCANGAGRYVSYSLKTLLPLPFSKEM